MSDPVAIDSISAVDFYQALGLDLVYGGRDAAARLWGIDANVFAFLINDAFGCALRGATLFASLARVHCLNPTRAPADAATHSANP